MIPSLPGRDGSPLCPTAPLATVGTFQASPCTQTSPMSAGQEGLETSDTSSCCAFASGRGDRGLGPSICSVQQPSVSWVCIHIKTQLENEPCMARTIMFQVFL